MAQGPSATERLTSQLSVFNQTLARADPALANPQQLRLELTQRAGLFSALMISNPAAALSLALPQDLVHQLSARAPAGTLESRGEWQGRVEVTVVDDFEHPLSQRRWYLRTNDEKLELFFARNQELTPGTSAIVCGVRLGNRMAVESTRSGGAMEITTTQTPCTTTGPQHIAVIMFTMPLNPTFPPGYTAESVREAFFGNPSDTSNTSSLNGFWKEVSYGLTSAVGEVYGPFALTQNYDSLNEMMLLPAAVNVADATVDFSKFTRLALLFPANHSQNFDIDSTVGCIDVISPSQGHLQLSVSQLPAFPDSSPYVEIYIHEFGHALGLGHSSTDDYGTEPLGPFDVSGALNEYGDKFSAMGGNAGHFTAEHKALLGWLNPGSGYLEVTTSGTFTIMPLESGADPRALRILRDPNSGAWLWVEFRQPLGDVDGVLKAYGSNILSGASIHYEDPLLDNLHSYLLDFNPLPATDRFFSPALIQGQSWSDPSSLLSFTVNSVTPQGLQMSVRYDQSCAVLKLSADSFPAPGGNGSITVTAPGTCAWTAATGDSWITLTGPTSGQGNSTVSFSLSANAGMNQRNGSITVQRQSIAIKQLGARLAVLGVDPIAGAGAGGQFTFRFYDPEGNTEMGPIHINFGAAPHCSLTVFRYSGSGIIYLIGDDGRSLGPITTSTGSALSNSYCSIQPSGTSFGGTGNELLVTVQMRFLAALAGSQRISAQAYYNGGSTSVIPLGTWAIPTAEPPAINITSNVMGAPLTVDGTVYQTPITLYLPVGSQHTVTWLAEMQGHANTRYTFQKWTDGGANPRVITIPAANATYTASIAAAYHLTLAVLPAAGGSLTASPRSADGFYDAGQVVLITAIPAAGYYLASYSGDIAGLPSITMEGPRSLIANFNCRPLLDHGPSPNHGSGLIDLQAGRGCSPPPSTDLCLGGVRRPCTGNPKGPHILCRCPE